jgi:hypothetical protein
VYRNAIPHVQEIIKFLREYKYWEKWYDVGKQIHFPVDEKVFNFKNAPTREE